MATYKLPFFVLLTHSVPAAQSGFKCPGPAIYTNQTTLNAVTTELLYFITYNFFIFTSKAMKFCTYLHYTL